MKALKNIIPVAVMTVVMLFMLGGCGETEKSMSKADYASSVVLLYSQYSDKFDEISTAIQKGQRVTITNLCDEAEVILDDMQALKPPLAFKDEHKKISKCCDYEKEKLELQKEYIGLLKDTAEMTDKEKERQKEIEDKMSELSVKSGNFYNEVDNLAKQQLQTQTSSDGNMVNW